MVTHISPTRNRPCLEVRFPLPHFHRSTGGEDVGFRINFPLGLIACVSMCGSAAWTQADDSSHITVFVNDSVGIDRAMLKRAEAEAARLFRPAGIAINWRNCADTSDCRRPPRTNEFVLHIVSDGRAPSDFVFGEAFLGPDGKGAYADVFFHRLRQTGGKLNIAQLLGAVSAHELGHLLLGSHSHALIGIMEPTWGPESLRRISMGNLTFTPEQQRAMRDRFRSESLAVSLSRDAEGLGLQ